MRNSATDVWNDLRAKRLWPVALLLLVAIVAVPALVMKSAEEPRPEPAPAASGARGAADPTEFDGLASVELVEESSAGSSLDTFDPSNPFRPPERVLEQAEQPSSDATPAGPTGDTATTDGSGGSSSADGSSGGASKPSGDSGSTGDTGSQGDSQSGDGSENGGGTTTTTDYTWVIDVTFANNGRTRKIKGLERLDMLPSTASPLLLFLGVSPDAGNAVFLVDSKLETAGEGRCEPSNVECGFLYLGPGSEHMFTNQDGDTYRLRVDQIRKVKVIEAGAKQAKATLSASGARRRFSRPLISDLVSMSRAMPGGSNRGRTRR